MGRICKVCTEAEAEEHRFPKKGLLCYRCRNQRDAGARERWKSNNPEKVVEAQKGARQRRKGTDADKKYQHQKYLEHRDKRLKYQSEYRRKNGQEQ